MIEVCVMDDQAADRAEGAETVPEPARTDPIAGELVTKA